MFDDMAWQRGIVNPFKPKNIQLTGRIWNGDLSGVKSLADRYGLQYGTDDDGEIFSLSKNNRTIFSFTQYKIYREGLFNISIVDLKKPFPFPIPQTRINYTCHFLGGNKVFP